MTNFSIPTAFIGSTDERGSFYTGDVDSDGDLDRLSFSTSDQTLRWTESNDDGLLTERTLPTSTSSDWSVHWIDWDGDGDRDLLVTSLANKTALWFESDRANPERADGNVSYTPHVIWADETFASSIYVADLEGDGDLDVLSVSGEGDELAITWYDNPGQPQTERRGTAGDDENLRGTARADKILGLSGDDEIAGSFGDDLLDGGPGNDVIQGQRGDDKIFGRSGRDDLSAGFGDDWVFGGDGADTLRGFVGNDLLHGGDGPDTLRGENDHDILFGGKGRDNLIGGYGDDLLDGGLGDDGYTGDFGSDTFVLRPGDGNDTVWDYQDGVDQFKLAGGLTFGSQEGQVQAVRSSFFNTQLKIVGSNEVLATLLFVSPSSIDATDFV